MDVWARVAVRGIIFIGDKLLLLDDNKGEVSLPGGGQDEGESDADTLIREIREETGYSVIPDTIRPFGYIEEKRRDFKSYHESRIFHQISRLYFCEVSAERGETPSCRRRQWSRCCHRQSRYERRRARADLPRRSMWPCRRQMSATRT